MLLERFSKEQAQIGECQFLLLFHVIALHNLVTDKQVLTGRSQARVAVGWLHDTRNALRIQAIHNTFMRDKRNIAEKMHLQADGFVYGIFYRRGSVML